MQASLLRIYTCIYTYTIQYRVEDRGETADKTLNKSNFVDTVIGQGQQGSNKVQEEGRGQWGLLVNYGKHL